MDCSRIACGAVLQSVERRRSYGTLKGTPTTARSASRMSRSLQRGTSNIEGRPTGTGLSNGLSTRLSFVGYLLARCLHEQIGEALGKRRGIGQGTAFSKNGLAVEDFGIAREALVAGVCSAEREELSQRGV